jgi:hypothetical protein
VELHRLNLLINVIKTNRGILMDFIKDFIGTKVELFLEVNQTSKLKEFMGQGNMVQDKEMIKKAESSVLKIEKK